MVKFLQCPECGQVTVVSIESYNRLKEENLFCSEPDCNKAVLSPCTNERVVGIPNIPITCSLTEIIRMNSFLNGRAVVKISPFSKKEYEKIRRFFGRSCLPYVNSFVSMSHEEFLRILEFNNIDTDADFAIEYIPYKGVTFGTIIYPTNRAYSKEPQEDNMGRSIYKLYDYDFAFSLID